MLIKPGIPGIRPVFRLTAGLIQKVRRFRDSLFSVMAPSFEKTEIF